MPRCARSNRPALWGILALSALAGSSAASDPYAPPANYYNNATGVGAQLKESLRQIVTSGHVRRTYGDARFILPVVDADPDVANRIILVYNGASVPATWDAGATWNREHTWPVSRGLGSQSSFEYCDLHQLRGCNPSINSSRGNKPFGPASTSYYDPGIFGQPYRGEMARAMMYMDTRYTQLTLVHGFPSASQMGDLTQLLAWHYEEPVRESERRRNHLIGSTYQFNRNPFMDRPEYVWAIFSRAPGQPLYPAPGNPWPNESTIYIGSAPEADGSSTLAVDLGNVLQHADAPGETVFINKLGQTPTTYRVTTTGEAVADRSNWEAFPFNAGVQTLTVGFDAASTGVLGEASGTVIVTNTDLTSAGLGMGAQDADDVVELTMRVVAPGVPSFDPDAQVLSTTVDLGVAGSGTVGVDIPLYVLPGGVGVTPAQTAGLVIAPLDEAGDLDAIQLILPPGLLAEPLTPATLVGQLSASAGLGSYAATFELELLQDAVGVSPLQTVTLTLTGVVGSPCPADITGPAFDGVPDGSVNIADLNFYLAAWMEQSATGPAQTGFNADLTGPSFDGVPDGSVNIADLNFYLDAWLNSQGACQ
ncbi:MAG: hypothetical protein EA378_00560 [Phycisphaerales bacterium]|nr:MAG: hypothetical protein EA378_00560 [Phycisphaerales bacterium]